jgi:hypothetical protein
VDPLVGTMRRSSSYRDKVQPELLFWRAIQPKVAKQKKGCESELDIWFQRRVSKGFSVQCIWIVIDPTYI